MSEGLGGGATETAAAAVPFDPPGGWDCTSTRSVPTAPPQRVHVSRGGTSTCSSTWPGNRPPRARPVGRPALSARPPRARTRYPSVENAGLPLRGRRAGAQPPYPSRAGRAPPGVALARVRTARARKDISGRVSTTRRVAPTHRIRTAAGVFPEELAGPFRVCRDA